MEWLIKLKPPEDDQVGHSKGKSSQSIRFCVISHDFLNCCLNRNLETRMKAAGGVGETRENREVKFWREGRLGEGGEKDVCDSFIFPVMTLLGKKKEEVVMTKWNGGSWKLGHQTKYSRPWQLQGPWDWVSSERKNPRLHFRLFHNLRQGKILFSSILASLQSFKKRKTNWDWKRWSFGWVVRLFGCLVVVSLSTDGEKEHKGAPTRVFYKLKGSLVSEKD